MPVIPFWATIVGASASSGAATAAASALASGTVGFGAATAAGTAAAGLSTGAIAAGATAAVAGGMGAALATGASAAGAGTSLIGGLTQSKLKMPSIAGLLDTSEAKDMTVETAAKSAAQILKNKKMAVARAKTVYTSPLGETDEADISIKTLLGK